MNRRRTVIAGLLATDLLLFGGWIASLEHARSSARVKLPVEGFDPRDLLRGHFVRFQLVAAGEAGPLLRGEPEGARIELCLEERRGMLHVTRVRTDDCKPFIAGALRGGRVDFGVDRFFVDERIAGEVAFVRAGPETYVVATIDGGGAVHVIDLVVDGKSVARK